MLRRSGRRRLNVASFINIQGAEELLRTLRALPAKVEAQLLRGACRAAAKVVQEEAERLVPRLSGKLAGTLRVTSSISVKKGEVHSTVVAGDRKQVFYAGMVEKGTKRHYIRVSDARTASTAGRLNRLAKRGMLKIGPGVFVSSVIHPGARPKPFMGPALNNKATEAVEAAAKYIRDHLDEAVK